MGFFVDLKCSACKYEETSLGVGRGKNPTPFLALFRCDRCKSIGSTWVQDGRNPRCSLCYHDAVTILPDDTRSVDCPKCGKPARIAVSEGSWD